MATNMSFTSRKILEKLPGLKIFPISVDRQWSDEEIFMGIGRGKKHWTVIMWSDRPHQTTRHMGWSFMVGVINSDIKVVSWIVNVKTGHTSCGSGVHVVKWCHGGRSICESCMRSGTECSFDGKVDQKGNLPANLAFALKPPFQIVLSVTAISFLLPFVPLLNHAAMKPKVRLTDK